MELLILQPSSASCHFYPLRSKFSSQHPIHKHPQFVFFPLCVIIRWKWLGNNFFSAVGTSCAFIPLVVVQVEFSFPSE
jgi:hypothetical protein